MDPISIIGLSGAVLGIVDIIGRTVSSLRTVQTKYQSADLAASLVIGQLSTLKAALGQIGELTKHKDFLKLHHQILLDDLTTAIDGCRVVIVILDEQVDRFDKYGPDKLTSMERIAFVWGEQDMNQYLSFLNNQSNALNLLLTAMHCRSTLSQQALLQSDESRTIINTVESDSSSMIAIDDVASFRTERSKMTHNSASIDVTFDFDRQIFSSKPYLMALTSAMKQKISTTGARQGIRDAFNSAGSFALPIRPSMTKGLDSMLPNISENPFLDLDDFMLEKNIVAHEPSSPNYFPQTMEEEDNATIRDHPITAPVPVQANPGEDNVKTSPQRATAPVKNPQARNSQSRIVLSTATTVSKRSENMGQGSDEETAQGSLTGNRFANIPRPQHSSIPVKPLRPGRTSLECEIKTLILGASESGKSTLLKSLRLECEGAYDRGMKMDFKEIIFTNTVQSMRVVLEAMESFEIPLHDPRAEFHVETIFMQPTLIEKLDGAVRAAIQVLWMDAGVRTAFNRSREYQLTDSARYYFDSINRIADVGYTPTCLDILYSRVKTTGITETTVQTRNYMLRLFDPGGTRSERKKWIHVFENVDVIAFTVDIACYDQLLFEDETVNRMSESLTLFDSIVNSKWFLEARIILVFTKVDRLYLKLGSSPPKNYLPGFEGGSDRDGYINYITESFVNLAHDHSVPVIYTSIEEDGVTSLGKSLVEKIDRYYGELNQI